MRVTRGSVFVVDGAPENTSSDLPIHICHAPPESNIALDTCVTKHRIVFLWLSDCWIPQYPGATSASHRLIPLSSPPLTPRSAVRTTPPGRYSGHGDGAPQAGQVWRSGKYTPVSSDLYKERKGENEEDDRKSSQHFAVLLSIWLISREPTPFYEGLFYRRVKVGRCIYIGPAV